MQIFALNLELQTPTTVCDVVTNFCIFSKVNDVITRTLGVHLNMFENKLLVSSKLLNSGIYPGETSV